MQYTDKSSGQTWIIPAGTPCSSISLRPHSDPSTSPNPEKFCLERWIENPRLDKYLFSFTICGQWYYLLGNTMIFTAQHNLNTYCHVPPYNISDTVRTI